MKGYIYTLYRGADPGKGFVMTDPIYDDVPTLGACMPNIRKLVSKGDYIFTISGRVPNVKQYIVGGFEVENKLNTLAALDYFPDKALRKVDDGTFRGNIIINKDGTRVEGDYHTNFEKRLDNYIIGKNPMYISNDNEIEIARAETLDILKKTFKSDGDSVFDILGRWRKMDEGQIKGVLEWLSSIKQAS